MELEPEVFREWLRTNPKPYSALDPTQRAFLRGRLRPSGPFSEQQINWLDGFYMQVSEAELAAVQAALPPGMRLGAKVRADGQLLIRADLLTDCLSVGDPWHPAAPMFARFTICHCTEALADLDMPEPEEPKEPEIQQDGPRRPGRRFLPQ